jgi:hypothetical protein
MPLIHGASYPDYQFQEYPKWITLADGAQKIVEDAFEEHQLLGTKEANPEPEFVGFKGFEFKLDPIPVVNGFNIPIEDDTPPDITPESNNITEDIETLRKQADDLGLIYDKRWGALKLRQAIDSSRKRATAEE